MRLGSDVQMSRGLLSFEVSTTEGQVLAFLSLASCQAGSPPAGAAQTLAQFVSRHRLMLDRIVAAKVLAGARHPVVLMASDLVDHAMDSAAAPQRSARDDRPASEGIEDTEIDAIHAIAALE